MNREVVQLNQLSNLWDRITEYFLLLDDCPLTPYEGVIDLCDRLCPYDKGVYVLYQKRIPMYVGRSDRIKRRIREQMNPNSGQRVSACASERARKFTTVHLKTRYPECRGLREKSLRNSLLKAIKGEREFKKLFKRNFADAKDCVSHMKVRAVQITDPNDQAIFEICAHLSLQTPYNNFINH